MKIIMGLLALGLGAGLIGLFLIDSRSADEAQREWEGETQREWEEAEKELEKLRAEEAQARQD